VSRKRDCGSPTFSENNNPEAVSKPQMRFKGKARADRESAAYVKYVSIYQRSATQPLSLRWGFETASKVCGNYCRSTIHAPADYYKIRPGCAAAPLSFKSASDRLTAARCDGRDRAGTAFALDRPFEFIHGGRGKCKIL